MTEESQFAVDQMKKGYSCSQAVLSAFAERFGLTQEQALKLAAPFAGGIGRQSQVCGAVSGGLMVIGLKYGHTDGGSAEAKEVSLLVTRRFCERFKQRHDSMICTELLGYDLGQPGVYKQVQDAGIFINVCRELVRDAAEMVVEMIDSEIS